MTPTAKSGFDLIECGLEDGFLCGLVGRRQLNFLEDWIIWKVLEEDPQKR